MKKKLLAMLFVSVIALLTFAVAVSAETSNGWEYEYDSQTRVLTVTTVGTGELYHNGVRIGRTDVKHMVFEEGVTTIPSYMGYSNQLLESVTLPSTITTISSNAFASSSLKTVTIPEGTTINEVARRAFNATSITSFDADVSVIGDEAFRACYSLVSLDLGDGVTSIGNYAFAYCPKLETITFDGTLTAIPNFAFWSSSALKSIDIPDSVTTIGQGAFISTTALATVEFPSSLTEIKSHAFKYSGISGNVVIPEGVTAIGEMAFYSCVGNMSITLPSTLRTLGKYCFATTAINAITLNEGLTAIPIKAFAGAINLKQVVIPETVTNIGSYAFTESGITSIVIPAASKTLGNGVFWGCKSLASAEIKAPLTAIPMKTFMNCTALKTANIPETVVNIAPYCFYTCTKLESINIPAGLKLLQCYAFENTYSLKIDIVIPGGLIAPTYSENGTSLSTIGDKCFKKSGITSVTFAEGITSVGYETFRECPNLTEITLPTTCTTVLASAFRACGITEATIPSVTSFGDKYVFYGNPSKVLVHTLEDSTYVIDWVNTTGSNVTLGDYVTTEPEECTHANTTVVPAVAPTCTDTGLTEGSTCNDCGVTVVEQSVVAALGHTYGDAVVTAATPWEVGKSVKACACGAEEIETIAFEGYALGLDVTVTGNTATAKLDLFNAPALTSVAFSIKYKGADLTLTEAKTALTHGYTTDPYVANPVKFVWMNGLENVDINGTVATFTFTVTEGSVVDTGDFNITYDADDVCAYNEANELVNVELPIYVRVVAAE